MSELPAPRRNSGLAYQSDFDGEWMVAYPGDPMYSTVTFSATHFSQDGEWKKLYDDECTDDAHRGGGAVRGFESWYCPTCKENV